MAYKITDKCISCGACAAECPVGCISQGDTKFEIDASACISCGTITKIRREGIKGRSFFFPFLREKWTLFL